jgi:hypothetical protein
VIRLSVVSPHAASQRVRRVQRAAFDPSIMAHEAGNHRRMLHLVSNAASGDEMLNKILVPVDGSAAPYVRRSRPASGSKAPPQI